MIQILLLSKLLKQIDEFLREMLKKLECYLVDIGLIWVSFCLKKVLFFLKWIRLNKTKNINWLIIRTLMAGIEKKNKYTFEIDLELLWKNDLFIIQSFEWMYDLSKIEKSDLKDQYL